MAGGQVNTLVMVGWNPAFTAPADLEFEANLKKVANIDLSGAGCGRDCGGFEVGDSGRALSRELGRCHRSRRNGEHPAADDSAAVRRQDGGGTGRGRSPGYKDQKAYDIVRNYWLPTLPAARKAGAKRCTTALLPARHRSRQSATAPDVPYERSCTCAASRL